MNAEVEKKTHQTEIFEYIRRKQKGKVVKVGVVVGKSVDGRIRVAWSKCNLKMGDVFDAQTGLDLARQRLINMQAPKTPNCIRRQVRQFGARCVRYFKGAHTVELPV